MSYRGSISRIEYGIDTEEPDLDWAFPIWDQPGLASVGADVLTYRSIPMNTRFMTVRLSFKDGTVSEIVRFDR